MTLWSKRGSYPVELPFMDVDGGGDTWTDLAHNEAGRNICGWVEAPQPEFNSLTQFVTWQDGSWVVHEIDANQDALNILRTSTLSALAGIRWVQQQSFVFGAQRMPADDVTIGRCTAAEAYARNKGMDFDEPRNWKIQDGVWTTLTTNQIIAYGIAIGDHMQACFDWEKILSDQIMAATTGLELNAIDLHAGWPE